MVTGGSSGIGLALAERLGEEGYEVLVVARGKERLDKAVAGIQARGGKARGYSCDVTDEAGLRALAAEVKETYGGIDYLVINAGIVMPKLFADYTDTAELRKQLDVDLWGVILQTHVMLPLVPRGGKILMTSSGFGLMGAAGYSLYCAAKAGVIMFASALRREQMCKGIEVYVSVPGDVDTEGYRKECSEAPEWMSKTPPSKVYRPEAIARNILKGARGGRRCMVVPQLDPGMRLLLPRLPVMILDQVLDRIFPRPR